MTQLKLQTVYVPVASNKNTEFQVERWAMNEWRPLKKVEPLDNRIVLTPQELRKVISGFIEFEGGLDNFLKSKGIVI